MSVPVPVFVKRTIGDLRNAEGASPINTLCIVGDCNADGRLDIVVGGRNGRLAWFENPGDGVEGLWRMHLIDSVRGQECGGLLHDLTGRMGRPHQRRRLHVGRAVLVAALFAHGSFTRDCPARWGQG